MELGSVIPKGDYIENKCLPDYPSQRFYKSFFRSFKKSPDEIPIGDAIKIIIISEAILIISNMSDMPRRTMYETCIRENPLLDYSFERMKTKQNEEICVKNPTKQNIRAENRKLLKRIKRSVEENRNASSNSTDSRIKKSIVLPLILKAKYTAIALYHLMKLKLRSRLNFIKIRNLTKLG